MLIRGSEWSPLNPWPGEWEEEASWCTCFPVRLTEEQERADLKMMMAALWRWRPELVWADSEMRQLTLEAIEAQKSARWVMTYWQPRWVGIMMGQAEPGCPNHVVVIGCSLTRYEFGGGAQPQELHLRLRDLREVDPAELPAEVVGAVLEAWLLAQRRRTN